jgi:two-component system sensor histidine kinase BarA
VSYRGFKHLIGETSLERKCRFIFGGGILVLVTLSFFLYGWKTETLVIGQTKLQALAEVQPAFEQLHYRALSNKDFAAVIQMFSGDLSPVVRQKGAKTHIIKPYPLKPVEGETQKPDPIEQEALARFLRSASAEEGHRKAGTPKKPDVFGDGTPMSDYRKVVGQQQYKYLQAIVFESRCLTSCHLGTTDDSTEFDNHVMREVRPGKFEYVKAGDLAGVMVVDLPMGPISGAINQNRGILIATALATAILAMIASYVIVRYVIVKPLKHLRDVSDAIAAGQLNIRSQIQTGDEFEDLSHAFNRMLHNLVAMQQELREVNKDLDRKVDELAQANMALFEMNRLKSDFLATMSHELRTPLNSIIGFSEVLSTSDQLAERQRRYAANIQTSGKMLLGMINDILDLAKIESGKMEVHTEDFSLRDVCEGLTGMARAVAERKAIDLESRLDEAIPLLRQDPGKLRQILYNLLSNAIKFTPEGGRVSLNARVEGRFAVIEVEDTGIGIAEEDQDKIFEKFRQVSGHGPGDGVLTREHQGTGLGLSIVRELTKLLGGDVVLQSRLGQGSRFTVRIPMQLPGNRKFEVNLSDERIDLTKARRVETRGGPLTRLELDAGETFPSPPHPPRPFEEPVRGPSRER